ncbi:MAG: YfhO family protein [Eubacteriales bacterium]
MDNPEDIKNIPDISPQSPEELIPSTAEDTSLPEPARIPEIKAKSHRKKDDREYIPPKRRYLFLAFFVPFALMFAAFGAIQLYPFGDRQIMVIDAWHQYYPFLNELHTKLTEGGSLLYSWNGGLGSNFLVLISYYAASPVYLLSVLCPQEYLREFMALATLIKIGCSGLFFGIYLKGIYKRCDITTVAFSTLYAMSAYAMGYYWCIMWLDCMALLPLIMLGLEKLLTENKFKLYSISLAVALISNYYIGAFICEFVFLYYFVRYFSIYGIKSFKHFVRKLVQTGFFSAIAVGLSAFMLLPTFKGLQLTANISSSPPSALKTYHTLLDIFNNLLVNIDPAVRKGLPNIHCGLIAVILVILIIFTPRIKSREKVLTGFLLLFLALSFNINYLDYVWHGFHFPNEIPYRYAFVFSFVVVSLAYKSFLNLKDISVKAIGVMTCLGMTYLVAAERLFKDSEWVSYYVFYVSMLFLLLYAGVLMAYKNGKIDYRAFCMLLFIVIFGESGLSAVRGASTVGSSQRLSYLTYYDSINGTAKSLYEKDNDLYRLEMSHWYTTNDPALYGYRGISLFSSEANSNVTKYLQKLGIAASAASNRYLYDSSTAVVNMMLSLKYMMSKDSSFTGMGFSKIIVPDITGEFKNVKWWPIKLKLEPVGGDWDEMLRNPFQPTFTQIRSYQSILEKTIPDTAHQWTTDDGKYITTMKYIAKSGEARRALRGEKPAESTDTDVTAYKNRYWLPIGFMTDNGLYEWEGKEQNPFEVQSDFINKSTGKYYNLFTNLYPASYNYENLNASRSEYGVYTYRNENAGASGKATFTYHVDSVKYVYIFAKINRGDNVTVRYGANTQKLEAKRGVIVDVGYCTPDNDINVSFDVEAADQGSFSLYVCSFNKEAYEEAYGILSQGAMQVEDFDDTHIKGTVNASSDGVLYTSIPYEKGWKVKVDGQSADVVPLMDAVCTVELKAGQHEIEFYYITDGLVPGLIATFSSILIIIIISAALYIRRKRKPVTAATVAAIGMSPPPYSGDGQEEYDDIEEIIPLDGSVTGEYETTDDDVLGQSEADQSEPNSPD